MRNILVGISVFNEGKKISRVVEKFADYDIYDVLIVDDGSTDRAVAALPQHPAVTVVRNQFCRGAGFTTRQIIRYAQQKGYQYVIFVSGNDKDDPKDVVKLNTALKEGHDFVQGSRFLPGGGWGRMPLYRLLATRFLHPALFSLLVRRQITDSTNGFRGVRLSFFLDQRMDIDQDWLDQYELEPYVFYYAIRLGYKVTEVPVTKVYPSKDEGYTKMKPWIGWWSILRPLVYLGTGLRK
jgi:dolichol-phosphate mannosyltransferase